MHSPRVPVQVLFPTESSATYAAWELGRGGHVYHLDMSLEVGIPTELFPAFHAEPAGDLRKRTWGHWEIYNIEHRAA